VTALRRIRRRAGSERSSRLARSFAVLAMVAAGVADATPAVADVDPALITGLDGVVALSPADTCLRVDLGRTTIYEHAVDVALIPASTQKLLVGHVALEVMGADHRFRTEVVGNPPVDGVVEGDLTLVGGGDPLLSTAADAFVRRIADQPITFLDELADEVVAAGVKHVRGGVVGDESRYDQTRVVASWPERYLSQNQVGPLSALTVNDGYRLVLSPDAEPDHERSADPAADAALALIDLLRERGVVVDGGAGNGRAPAGATALAHVESAPLSAVFRQLLEQSDNGTAELLTKELGVRSGDGGTTAAGTAFIREQAAAAGLPVGGLLMADGSGLDRNNRATCDELVEVLTAAGGPDGLLAGSLPVAGRTGTLRNRFRGTPAEGRLMAKTGSLNDVTSLAGFVEMPDGQIATFAYIANGPQADDPRRGQDFLGALLGQYERVCPAGPAVPLVAPVGAYALGAAALAPVGLAPMLSPAVIVALDTFEEHPEAVVSSCLVEDPTFRLRLPA